jgi:sugar lactone lactonase YvrE/DNA-directed RNA polymerase subunit RPC12/RpoP
MAKDASMRAFKCPTCGAPLEPESGTLTMKCPYCGGTVIIPESLRTSPPSSGPSMGEVFQFGLNGVDLNKIMGNAMHLPQAISLAQQGKIDEAADIYSQITGLAHPDAVKAVKAMAAGKAVSLTPGRSDVNWQQIETTYNQPDQGKDFNASSATIETTGSGAKSSGRGCGLVVGIMLAGILLVIGIVIAGIYFFSNGTSAASIIPFGFANKTLSFGGEGIGAGLLEDARSLGVDANGNITVADYEDGRIQTFDPTGKFISTFSINPDGKKVYIGGMVVDRAGNSYIVHNGKISVYDKGGTLIKDIDDDKHFYGDVALGSDGTLYAVSDGETIVRFKSDKTIDLEIPDTFTNATGDSESDAHLAVDGLGNIYIVGAFNYAVLKFSPQRKFMNRFGSKGDGAGKFTDPLSIAVDGYGRVFIGDFFGVLVFDSNGAYLNTINMSSGVAYGITFDDLNNLYIMTSQNQIQKYQIQKPPAD